MNDLYQKLFFACNENKNFSKDSVFVAIKGSHYDNNTVKLLLVGRAPNSWNPRPNILQGCPNCCSKACLMTRTSPAVFGHSAQTQFNCTLRWNWIESRKNILYGTGTSYCISNKAFWAYAESILRKLIQDQQPKSIQEDPIWMKNIAWSNLYKISPAVGGNPNSYLRELQREVCVSILKEEIDVLKPTHVLFMTGYDWLSDYNWSEDFRSIFSSINYIGKNVQRGIKKNDIYVEATAYYNNNIKIVIACRPETRTQEPYTEAVFQAFKSMPDVCSQEN